MTLINLIAVGLQKKNCLEIYLRLITEFIIKCNFQSEYPPSMAREEEEMEIEKALTSTQTK